jgi:DNA (cytosine-5)-methyltransferase 1
MSQPIRFIDLFAGTGAFKLALEKTHTQFRCVFSNDMMDSSETIYKANHPNCFFQKEDIQKIKVEDIPAHDMLCAGFPCQPFSIAGQQKGFEDERANVFWKLMEIIQFHRPQILLLENVKNLKSHDEGRTFQIITKELTNAGYHIKYDILDTCKITDIPQHRERVYIACFLDKAKCDAFDFDFENVPNQPISDLLEMEVPQKYYYTEKLKVYAEVKANITKPVQTDNVLYQYRRYYVRENKHHCCPTLTANMGSGGHNVPLLLDGDKGIRKLTPRECFHLQGFPKDYVLPSMLKDTELYKLAGNAVSVPVVSLVSKKIAKLFLEQPTTSKQALLY